MPGLGGIPAVRSLSGRQPHSFLEPGFPAETTVLFGSQPVGHTIGGKFHIVVGYDGGLARDLERRLRLTK